MFFSCFVNNGMFCMGTGIIQAQELAKIYVVCIGFYSSFKIKDVCPICFQDFTLLSKL